MLVGRAMRSVRVPPMPPTLRSLGLPVRAHTYSTGPGPNIKFVATPARRNISSSNKILVATGLVLTGSAAVYFSLAPATVSKTMTTGNSSPASTVGGSGLTKAEADAMLRHAQRTLLLGTATSDRPQFVVRCDMASVASNDPIEDYTASHTCRHGLLFAVMDGHGGTECAREVQKYLGAYVANALDAALSPKTAASWTDSLARLVYPDAQAKQPPSPLDPAKERRTAITNALVSAFTRLDADIVNGGIDVDLLPTDVTNADAIKTHLRPALAGSCALLAFIDGVDVYVACTGDSRAVLGRRTVDGVWETLNLSQDQTTRNAQEYNRLLEEHPGELETVVVKGRVLGGLMPTRAFGDARYKWPTQLSQVLLANITKRSPPKNYFTPPYVTAKPVVTHYTITPSRDMFLVLATDGLYDELSSEEVVTTVSGFLQHHKVTSRPKVEWGGSDPLANKSFSLTQDTNAATCLIRNALGGSDEEKLKKLLGIPAPYSRRFRDDITVNVCVGPALFFDCSDDSGVSSGLDGARLLSEATDIETKGLPEVDLKLSSAKQHRLQSWASYFARVGGNEGVFGFGKPKL